ncbi:D-hexose-6-phosphate mutarotase [Vibrio mangrovi]|uniref:Putative glucose-6-phosphate 1-epimerase n=1 Tax=Vibrio mangrovi TaxID=474394 RepID=A0A1Y6IPP5_9VIBR|nr:D-hexose-6-phosphate mutarotase [Vibrio mangrovi]MDW6003600.1 D-hexose-6-phosphate mutarotase [Vibrio mangrovi]SMR99608.1 Putative glucose-6-phosphate 1-epimerase [Vibrio mangrovi]
MDLHTLPTLTNLSNCVTIVEKDNTKIVRVIHDKATAGISLHGGHVISFQPTGKADLIWMSEAAIFDGKTALRGGIPVCWPWFARIGSPSHGFARTQQWTLVEHRESEEGVVVTLGLTANDETLAIWPYQFSLLLHVAISETLQVTLEITNRDEKPWTFSGALHTYLQVGDIRQTTTTGMGREYIDNLQDNIICQGDEVLQLTDTIDRVYTTPEPLIRLHDPVLKRDILVENDGHNSTVLWNPWLQGAQSMADMTDDGYQTMLCIESTVHSPCISAGITLQPGEQHQLKTTLTVSD